MPCTDCASLSAEISAQKSFMVKWFDIFMKEFQEAKVQAQEFRQEVRHKFDILGAGENFAHNNLAVKCSEDVGLSEGNEEGCSNGLSFNEFLEEPPQCCLPTQGREEEFCETSSSNVPSLAVVKEETSPNDGELGSVDVIPEIGLSCFDQSSSRKDVAWTDQPMLDESDLFVRAQEFSSKGKNRESFLQMKEQQRRLNISESHSWQRRLDFPHHVKPKECEICGGVVRPQTGGSARSYMMRCANKKCRKWWGSIDGFGNATEPAIKPVSTAAQASNRIKRKAIASRRKKEQMQTELDMEDFERVISKRSANATVKQVGGSMPSTAAPIEHAVDDEELDVTSCHACGSKCRKRWMFGKIRLACTNLKCGITPTAEGPLLPSCIFCGARTRLEKCKDRMKVRCASKACRKYMPAESFPGLQGLKKKQKKNATPKPIVVEDEDLVPCKFCGSATRNFTFKYKKWLQCTNKTCLQLVETRGQKKKLRQRNQAQREAMNNGTEDLNGFACRICSSVVRRSPSTMYNHAAIHLDFMAFKCPHCNYKTVTCGNIHRHIQNVHRTIPNPMPTVRLMSKEDYKLSIKNKLNQCFPNCKPTKLVD